MTSEGIVSTEPAAPVHRIREVRERGCDQLLQELDAAARTGTLTVKELSRAVLTEDWSGDGPSTNVGADWISRNIPCIAAMVERGELDWDAFVRDHMDSHSFGWVAMCKAELIKLVPQDRRGKHIRAMALRWGLNWDWTKAALELGYPRVGVADTIIEVVLASIDKKVEDGSSNVYRHIDAFMESHDRGDESYWNLLTAIDFLELMQDVVDKLPLCFLRYESAIARRLKNPEMINELRIRAVQNLGNRAASIPFDSCDRSPHVTTTSNRPTFQ